jgi:hypothetical protein
LTEKNRRRNLPFCLSFGYNDRDNTSFRLEEGRTGPSERGGGRFSRKLLLFLRV